MLNCPAFAKEWNVCPPCEVICCSWYQGAARTRLFLAAAARWGKFSSRFAGTFELYIRGSLYVSWTPRKNKRQLLWTFEVFIVILLKVPAFWSVTLCFPGQLVPDVLKALQSFETRRTTCLLTQHHIPEDLHFQNYFICFGCKFQRGVVRSSIHNIPHFTAYFNVLYWGHKFHKFTSSIIPFPVSPFSQLVVLFTHMLALITVAINKHFGLAARVEGVKGNKLNRKRGTPSTFTLTTHGNPFLWPNYTAVCNCAQWKKPCRNSIKIAGLSGGKTWI